MYGALILGCTDRDYLHLQMTAKEGRGGESANDLGILAPFLKEDCLISLGNVR